MTQFELLEILIENKDIKLTSTEVHDLYIKKYKKIVDKSVINRNLRRLSQSSLIWKGIDRLRKHRNIFWVDDEKIKQS